MQTCIKAYRSSLWKSIHGVENFVVASTAHYCNSGIYPICGSQVALTNGLSLWVNAYHLLHESPPTTKPIMCVLGELC